MIGSNTAEAGSREEPTQLERALRGELLGIWSEPASEETNEALFSSSVVATVAVADGVLTTARDTSQIEGEVNQVEGNAAQDTVQDHEQHSRGDGDRLTELTVVKKP